MNEARSRLGRPAALAAMVLLLGLIATLAVPQFGVASPSGQTRSPAAELTERGQALVAEQKLDEALQLFDEAIDADAGYGMAHYQRGRTLALMGRMEEAREALLHSTRLQPGFAHGHLLASAASRELGDYETAWDQAARAIIAGREPSEFGGLHQASPAPPEITARLEAPRVFVVGVDTRQLIADDQGPADARRGTTDIRSTLGQVQDDLLELQRHISNALSDTPEFGLVPSAEQAQYLLVITPEEIDANPRATMDGELRLYDAESREVAFVRSVSFRNLSAETAVMVEIERFIELLENWKRGRG